uniref:CSON010559 protein n=1 Tax=Culicoides sonorensis TaxID=179676 RepID=A0A336LI06_CULSO
MTALKRSFFANEMVCIGTEVNKCPQAQEDLSILCLETAKDGVSLLARDKRSGEIVGFLFNKIQFPSENPNETSYFEYFRDNKCKSESSKALMSYMIEMDSKVDVFEKFDVDCLMELMFLGVIPEYGKRGIGTRLCEVAVKIAKGLKNNEYTELLSENIKDKRPQLVAVLWTSRFSQRVGGKLQFKTLHEESHSNFSFNGKSFAERIGELKHPSSTLAVKMI